MPICQSGVAVREPELGFGLMKKSKLITKSYSFNLTKECNFDSGKDLVVLIVGQFHGKYW